jgi:DDHD domain
MFFIEVFELNEDSGGWVSKDKKLAPSGFFADPNGLFPLSGLTDALLPSFDRPNPESSSFGWSWASNNLVSQFGQALGARKLSVDGQWLSALKSDSHQYGEDGWQYAFDWTDEEWSKERAIGFLITAGSKVRRRRWIRPVIPSKELAQFFIEKCGLPSQLVLPAASCAADPSPSFLSNAEVCLAVFPPVKPHLVRHLVIATHGVGSPTDESLGIKISTMRQLHLDLCKAGYGLSRKGAGPDGRVERSASNGSEVAASTNKDNNEEGGEGGCVIDFDYCIWMNRSPRVSQINEWLSSLHVPTSPVVRETAKRTMLQAALYMTGCGFQEDIQRALEEEINRTYCSFLATHPRFADRDLLLRALSTPTTTHGSGSSAAHTGDALLGMQHHVSIFAHSLGGVISLDLLLKRGPSSSPTSAYGLCFVPSHLFTMGSPLGVYFSLRGLKKSQLESYLQMLYDGPTVSDSESSSTWEASKGEAVKAPTAAINSSKFPLPPPPRTLLHNIYSSQDAIAYLTAPLFWNEAKDGSAPKPSTLLRAVEMSTMREVSRLLNECKELDGRLKRTRESKRKLVKAASDAELHDPTNSTTTSNAPSLVSPTGPAGGFIPSIEVKIKLPSSRGEQAGAGGFSQQVAVLSPIAVMKQSAAEQSSQQSGGSAPHKEKTEALFKSLGIDLPSGWEDAAAEDDDDEEEDDRYKGESEQARALRMSSLHLGIGPSEKDLAPLMRVNAAGSNSSRPDSPTKGPLVTPLAQAYRSGPGRGLDLALPLAGEPSPTLGEEALSSFIDVGSVALGKDVKKTLPGGFPGGSSKHPQEATSHSIGPTPSPAGASAATPSAAAAGGGAGSHPVQSPSSTSSNTTTTAASSAGGGGGGGGGASSLINGFSTLAAVGDYLQAMQAHRVYWQSYDVQTHMALAIVKSEVDVAKRRLWEKMSE